eukprot:GHVR01074853.1.p1 GENE.GHVR01074853.1~~GHVR01074853.1.p1  ORF type:complete len:167 (+),score=25.21 GHVR01074853.1:259-759(+)
MLIGTFAQAEELWFSGRRQDWEQKKSEGIYQAVALLNPQTTNTLYDTNDVPYLVTNYTHTAENTNNVLWQINFSILDNKDNDAWIMGYTTEKCGGFDIDAQWAVLQDFCSQNFKFTCDRGMGLTEYMALYEYTWQSNAWLTLDIPFVDDNRKSQERKSEFNKEKKK